MEFLSEFINICLISHPVHIALTSLWGEHPGKNTNNVWKIGVYRGIYFLILVHNVDHSLEPPLWSREGSSDVSHNICLEKIRKMSSAMD